eukprot:2711745-Rhodomonas_salina.2
MLGTDVLHSAVALLRAVRCVVLDVWRDDIHLRAQPVLTQCIGKPGLKGKTVIVQGFGNVGYYAAKFFKVPISGSRAMSKCCLALPVVCCSLRQDYLLALSLFVLLPPAFYSFNHLVSPAFPSLCPSRIPSTCLAPSCLTQTLTPRPHPRPHPQPFTSNPYPRTLTLKA